MQHAGWQILLEDEFADVLDSTFVASEILGPAVAHMLTAMQNNYPQKEATVRIKWRKLARRPADTVDGEPVPAVKP